MYDTFEEASNRLLDTICMYDGQPVYIRDVRAAAKKNFRIYYNPMPVRKDWGDDIKEIGILDPKFQMTGLPLGYANMVSSDGRWPLLATYFARKPVRKFKQGLSQENLTTLAGYKFNAKVRILEANQFGWQTVLASKSFAKMMVGTYPSFKEAVKTVVDAGEGAPTTMAFSRQFAIEAGFGGLLNLHYKGEKIAWSEDAQRFKLAEDYRHFRELCQESNIELRGVKYAL